MVLKPIILEYYKFDESHNRYLIDIAEPFKIECILCNISIKASIKITSNWITQIRTCHKETYEEFLKKRVNIPLKRRMDVG